MNRYVYMIVAALFIFGISLTSLFGCSSTRERGEAFVETAGEEALATSVTGTRWSVWELCKGARIGALEEVLHTPAMRNARDELCREYKASRSGLIELGTYREAVGVGVDE